MNLEEMIQLQVLKFKAAQSLPGRMMDAAIDEAEAGGKVKVVQMCAKVSPQLFEAVNHVCSALDLTKREFIEAAVVEAVQIAQQHIAKMGDDLQQRMGGV